MSFHGIFLSFSLAASHHSSFEQNCLHCSWSQSVPNLLSVSIVRSFMCLSAFPCTLTFCSSSQMHALCAAVITSFCPRQPPLGMWPIVYLGSSPFQLLPLSSCAFLHSVHAAVLLYPYFSICCPQGNVPVTTWSNLLRLRRGIDFFFHPFPYFFSTRSLSEEEVRTPCTRHWSPHSPFV